MENGNNFEQQFTQDVMATAKPVAESTAIGTSNPSKLPLIIAIISIVVVLIESVILIFTLVNYFSLTNIAEGDDTVDGVYEDGESGSRVFDNDENITAFNMVCTAPNGEHYDFDLDNNAKHYDANNTAISSSEYSVYNSSFITLEGDKIIYYDGFNVVDYLTIYECEDIE